MNNIGYKYCCALFHVILVQKCQKNMEYNSQMILDQCSFDLTSVFRPFMRRLLEKVCEKKFAYVKISSSISRVVCAFWLSNMISNIADSVCRECEC